MPFCPEGFNPEPPCSRVVIAPDMTEPMEAKVMDNPDTRQTIQRCVDAGTIRSGEIAKITGLNARTVRRYLETMRRDRPVTYRPRYKDAEIVAMRSDRLHGVTISVLAEQWDTTPSQVSKICRGIMYAHVPMGVI